MKQTAVEWLEKKLIRLEKTTGVYGIMYELLERAKEMEKKQIGYSEEEVNKMFDTLKRNSIDNVSTITNVDLFITSWKREFKNKD